MYGVIWSNALFYGLLLYGIICYGMVWYGMICTFCNDVAQYGLAWCVILWVCVAKDGGVMRYSGI